VFDREDFIVMFGNMKEFMSKDRKETSQREITTAKTTSTTKMDIQRSDLHDITILGCGAFGKVLLVKNKNDGETYALKCQGKKSIVENGLQEHVINEAKVMAELDHPFIIKLYATMVDTQYIYFVMELLLGGEIFTHLRKLGSFEESWTRFYSGSVLAAFAIMHQKGMAYRDLKPENLVLDDKGYCKMVDLGLAKHIVDGKAWTLCGTPDYLAPEIILNEGHNIAVDYWALGVLIYEMVCGVPPFYAEEAMEIYERILNGTVPIPSSFSKSMGDIVRKLLKQQQTKRLGVTKGGTLAVMKHKWYSGFDWDGLIQRKLSVPILPQIKNREDHSNFESFTAELEEIEDCPEWNPEF
jgi:serine/threonine protein kinase